MNGFLVMFDWDCKRYSALRGELRRIGYPCQCVKDLCALRRGCPGEEPGLILVDFDYLSNATDVLACLRRRLPLVKVIGISSKHFHPELRDAFRDQIFACVQKPLNFQEVEFLVRSFFQDMLERETHQQTQA